jgi:CRISPR/Cas system-associated exonuclease Cas4 (RecB family)
VVFHPYGDVWEVWHNVPGDAPSAIRVEYNYKGVRDRWKTAVQQIVIGRTHFSVRRNVLEKRRIFFRIIEARKSPISEYRTS